MFFGIVSYFHNPTGYHDAIVIVNSFSEHIPVIRIGNLEELVENNHLLYYNNNLEVFTPAYALRGFVIHLFCDHKLLIFNSPVFLRCFTCKSQYFAWRKDILSVSISGHSEACTNNPWLVYVSPSCTIICQPP